MKKITALTLAVIMMLFALASCTGNGNEQPDDTENKNLVVIFQKGVESDYTVVYPKELANNNTLVSAAKGIVYQAQQKFKQESLYCSPEFSNFDIYEEHEILLGDTTRPESAEAKKLLKGVENEYAIKMFENGKLAIVASNTETLIKAAHYFTATFITENTTDVLAIEKGYEYYADLGSTPKVKWGLAVPEYVGGKVGGNQVYGIGINKTLSESTNGGNMRVISETNADEFKAYMALLENEGYAQTAKTENNGNIYVQYQNKSTNKLVYAYYLNYFGEARVIEDFCSIAEPEFEYSYTPKAGETSAYYQYGLMQDPYGNGNEADANDSEVWGNAGALDIIRLADNKLIVIDGGGKEQATDAVTEKLVEFMFEITNTPADGKVTIAAWFLTHTHGDHLYNMYNIATNGKYKDKFVVERMMNNVPTGNVMGTGTDFGKTAQAIIDNNRNVNDGKGVKFIKLHTGQNITLGNITVDVIMTHEDAVDPLTGKSFIIDQNNASTVLKFNINGRSVMYFGDWGGNDQSEPKKIAEYAEMERRILKVYETAPNTYPTLKADIVQIAHHAINSWMGAVYRAVDADYAFFSQQDIAFHSYKTGSNNRLTHACYITIIEQLRNTGMADEHMYFQGRKTNWLEIAQDGTMTHGERKLEGATEGYYYYTDANGNSLYEDTNENIVTDKSKGKLITDSTGNRTFSEISGTKSVYVKGYWDWLEGIKAWGEK